MTKEEALLAVAKRITECERCKYYPNQNPVPGEGNPDAQIMLIGEAPGAKENEIGRPFVGAAGKFLEEMLNSIGLERQDVFIANIIKYQPPGNRDPLPEEIQFQLPFLLKQIAIIKPKLICFLGRHSYNALLPGYSQATNSDKLPLDRKPLTISQVHGQLIRKDNQWYLPLYHPAAALYNGGMRQTLVDDFQKIPGYMDRISAESLT
jgi:uracil-DNA glycosylase family 4